jgi:hypothetical protein
VLKGRGRLVRRMESLAGLHPAVSGRDTKKPLAEIERLPVAAVAATRRAGSATPFLTTAHVHRERSMLELPPSTHH